ncbi:MAG TPA: hypothetical protein VJY33_26865 [Isosphaeraceae bacterium]|nr:hypothetical protein [Isosphaeraceae bacterium]
MTTLVPVLPIAWLVLLIPLDGEGDLPRSGPKPAAKSRATAPVSLDPVSEPACSIEAEVQSESLRVFDRPDDAAFVMGKIHRGDRLHVRVDRIPSTGWLAIEPGPTAIFWIEQSRLEFEDENQNDDKSQNDDENRASQDPDGRDRDCGRPLRAWIKSPGAMIRSGNVQARLPGPPHGTVPARTLVQIVDRPPLVLGQGARATRWLAIVPPPDTVLYVHAEGVRLGSSTPPTATAAEIPALYEEPRLPSGQRDADRPSGPSSAWPVEISAELDRLGGMHRAIVASQPIEQWHFETVRAGYQALLKQVGDRLDLEDTLRARLARVTEHEQAARAARTIEEILARSHRRDSEVAAVRRDLAQVERTRARAYDAVGFIQPSARTVDGHRVFALIGRKGSTIAYLDIPPGLDPAPLLAQRVGVRGQSHFKEDLGTRLITVRDLESVEARK